MIHPEQGAYQAPANSELIIIPEMARAMRKSRSGVDKVRAKDPTFPKPFKDGTSRQSRVYFVRAEFEEWLATKLDARTVA